MGDIMPVRASSPGAVPRRRIRSDVAALPHHAGLGLSGVREDAPCRSEIGAPAAIADATLLRFKRPIGHCTRPEKRLRRMKVYRCGGMSTCAIRIFIYQ